MPNILLPTPLEIVGFNTKLQNGYVGIRCEIDGVQRICHMLKANLIELFELDNPSQNLYELVDFLPVYAVASINGLLIEEIETFPSLAMACDKVASYECLDDWQNDGEQFDESKNSTDDTPEMQEWVEWMEQVSRLSD